MAESTILVALRSKRDEIENQIAFLEDKIAELRASLVHVNAVVHLFESAPGNENPAPYRLHLSKAFKPGEYLALSLAALRERNAPMTTSDLSHHVMAQKGWDPNDLVLRRSVVRRLSEALGKALKRGVIRSEGMRLGVRVWCAP